MWILGFYEIIILEISSEGYCPRENLKTGTNLYSWPYPIGGGYVRAPEVGPNNVLDRATVDLL